VNRVTVLRAMGGTDWKRTFSRSMSG